MRVVLVSLGTRDRFGGFDRALLGLGYLHAAVENAPRLSSRASVEHLVWDAERDHAGPIVDGIVQARPDIVGMGCYVWNTALALLVSRELKARRPDVRIVLGGPDATAMASRLLLENPAIDLIVLGEGESTFVEYLERELDGQRPDQTLRGVAFRENGHVQQTPARALIAELDTIPSPYVGGQLRPVGGCYVETLRGCPFDCSFCGWDRNRARYFSFERVKAEIDQLNRAEIKTVFFVDAIFNLNRPRAHQILEYLLEVKFKPWIWLELYPRLMDARTVELLSRIGRAYVGVGIQTTNPAAMEAIHRVWNPPEVERLLDPITPSGEPCLALEIIMGLPRDDLDGFTRTVNWTFDRSPGAIVCSHLHVLPNSELMTDAARLELVYDQAHRNRLISSPTMSRDDVALGHRMVHWIERWQGILDRLRRLSGQPVGNLTRAWMQFVAARGLQSDADLYHQLRAGKEVIERILECFETFVATLAIAPAPREIAARLATLARYMLARMALVGEGWHHFEGLDIAGIRFRSQGLIDPPWDVEQPPPRSPSVPLAALQFTVPLALVAFPFDPEPLLEARNVDQYLAVPPEPAIYLIFSHPAVGASRSCRVTDEEARLIEALAAGALPDRLGEQGVRLARGLIDCGLAEPLAMVSASR
ncbi:MAG: radical SAM protein [Planctomycetota bacterium]